MRTLGNIVAVIALAGIALSAALLIQAARQGDLPDLRLRDGAPFGEARP